MSEATSGRNCPECEGQLQPITLIDRSQINEFLSRDGVLTYASADAKPGYWSGSIPPAGVVEALACTKCGRILLYARKNA